LAGRPSIIEVRAFRSKAPGDKNSAGDVDRELYSLQRYLELLAEGQTVALGMLFAPEAVMLREPGPSGGKSRPIPIDW
jgi:hypothetical protein